MIRFRFVDEHRRAHGVKRMCDVLGWDRSGYYTWHKNKEVREEKAGVEEELAHRIREIHTDSKGAYGALRITRELRRRGQVVNRKRVARIMRERQIVGITRRKSRSLAKQDRAAAPAPDLILRDFTAPMPGLEPVGDITCLPTAEGWLYLATVIDLCTREVVGWSMADHMRTQLVEDAIRMAHAGGHTAGNAIFHSDRGSQYTSRQFHAALAELDIRQSVGRTASCFDNATAESFFAVLKAEIGTTVWETRVQARQDVFRWIAEHYNRERIHSTIGYITPYEARTRYRQRLGLAA
ncbi:IS3 family transposase [Streptomyces sp. E5N91]|uniref:IS3 family transposase n=1 Tax=Streptomyces sp. E5N91 TaxID=1851996 RepID=UPI000EF5C961|nr:IS3 family transposase [Streptomyces sp. E5N91]